MVDKILQIYFYKLPSGKEPVREFLKDLPKLDRVKVGALLHQLQLKHFLNMPHAKCLKNKLWELRVAAEKGQIRIFYFCSVREMIFLLHSFIKKSQKTPESEMELAMERKRYVEIMESKHEKK